MIEHLKHIPHATALSADETYHFLNTDGHWSHVQPVSSTTFVSGMDYCQVRDVADGELYVIAVFRLYTKRPPRFIPGDQVKLDGETDYRRVRDVSTRHLSGNRDGFVPVTYEYQYYLGPLGGNPLGQSCHAYETQLRPHRPARRIATRPDLPEV